MVALDIAIPVSREVSSLEEELASKRIPILDTEKVRTHKHAVLAERRPGIWKYLWPFALAIGWVLGFHLNVAFAFWLLFMCFWVSGLGVILWSYDVPVAGELAVATSTYLALIILAGIAGMKGWFPRFFNASSLWRRARFRENREVGGERAPLGITFRAVESQEIRGTKIYIEYFEKDPFLLVVRGSERYYIGAWNTGVPELDNA